MASADYFLFPKVKSNPKRRSFDTISDTQNNVTSEIKNIPAAEFYVGIQNFYVRADRCIALGRKYVEGYGVINLFSFRLRFFMNLILKLCRRTE